MNRHRDETTLIPTMGELAGGLAGAAGVFVFIWAIAILGGAL